MLNFNTVVTNDHKKYASCSTTFPKWLDKQYWVSSHIHYYILGYRDINIIFKIYL